MSASGLGIYFQIPGIPREEDIDWPDCAHWGSESEFNAFRFRIAYNVGIYLWHMEGFHNPHVEQVERQLSWDTVKNPLKPLLAANYDGGVFTPKECKAMAPIIFEAMREWRAEDPYKIEGLKLVEHMEFAAALKHNLEHY